MDFGVEITQAGTPRLPALAALMGRAFVDEPMMRWPLGVHGDIEERFTRCFQYFLEGVIPSGTVWEAGAANGAAAWISPGEMDVWRDAQVNESRMYDLTEDGGRRYDVFWAWVESKVPAEPLWLLDSVGVDRSVRGRGIGAALVQVGLARARADDLPAFLETGTSQNVPFYERLGFRVVDDAVALDGGPRIWFMRWDPARVAP
jgi:GNAT superfamily N-acetyltransferase